MDDLFERSVFDPAALDELGERTPNLFDPDDQISCEKAGKLRQKGWDQLGSEDRVKLIGHKRSCQDKQCPGRLRV